MPDLITHCSVAYLFKWIFRDKLALFVLGTILPDLLTRGLFIIFPPLVTLLQPMHTPFVLIFICYFLCLFFEEGIRKGVFIALLSGSCLHLFLDLFQIHIGKEEYLWFFPFSWKSYEIGLFWPEASVLTIPFWIILILVSERSFIWSTIRKPFCRRKEG